MAQTVSSVVDSGNAPSAGVSRAVFLKPTMPHSAAGMRMEPPVSEPSPMKAAPVATDTAAPEDEPPGMRAVAGSAGLAGVPKCGLMPTPENANSVMLVRPTRLAPAARRRATAALSAGGRRRIGQHRRAGGRDLAGDVEQVLDRDRQSGQRQALDTRPGGRGAASSGRVRMNAWAQAVDRAMASAWAKAPEALPRPLPSCSRVAMRSSIKEEMGGPCARIFAVLLDGNRMVRLPRDRQDTLANPSQPGVATAARSVRFRGGF